MGFSLILTWERCDVVLACGMIDAAWHSLISPHREGTCHQRVGAPLQLLDPSPVSTG